MRKVIIAVAVLASVALVSCKKNTPQCWEFKDKTGTISSGYFWGTKAEADAKNPSVVGISVYKIVKADKNESDCKAAEQFSN
jgi:hypothetical protein